MINGGAVTGGESTHAALDVIGFGALNIDFIASASNLSAARAERVAETTARFDWNVETRVDEETVHRVIGTLGHAAFEISPGGSAWNVIFALARMGLGLRLGYVGMVGWEETPGLSFMRQMDTHAVDHRYVGRDPAAPCGMCLSYIDDNGRVMLTCPGANTGMAAFISEHFEALAAYLAAAKYVHVTSFLDSETPVRMEQVLRAARQANPRLRISLDPGYAWAADPSPPVRGLIGLADYLMLTRREFKDLGSYAHGETDQVVAGRVLAACRPGATVIVGKSYDVIDTFRSSGEGVSRRRYQAAAGRHDEGIEDTTGAGDVLAAAVLAALCSRRLQAELGIYIGLSLARDRLHREVPHRGVVRAAPRPARYPDLSDGYLQFTEERPSWAAARRGVFVAHGADPQWRRVRTVIEQDWGLPVFDLSTETHGDDLASQIREHLIECGFAVCVLTAETHGPGKVGYADQSVVHQAGLLQGRYGFRRVAILVEEGCEAFSNVAGLIRLDFPSGRIESTFWQLERMLRREGLLVD